MRFCASTPDSWFPSPIARTTRYLRPVRTSGVVVAGGKELWASALFACALDPTTAQPLQRLVSHTYTTKTCLCRYVRFSSNDYAGTNVPGPAADFPVRVKATHSNMHKVEGRRAHRADAQGHFSTLDATLLVADEALVRTRLSLHHLSGPVGAPLKSNQSLLERGKWLWRCEWERTAVWVQRRRHECAMAFPGCIQIAQEWCVDDADNRITFIHKADGDANEWKAFDKVGRTIDGIDNPCRFICQCRMLAGCPCFFADKSA